MIIKAALVATVAQGEPPPDGTVRDAIFERLTAELHSYGMSVGEFLLRPVKGTGQRTVTRNTHR